MPEGEKVTFSNYHAECNRCKGRAYHARHRDRINAKQRETRRANKELNRERNFKYNLKRNYGLDLQTYEGLVDKQAGLCAICQTKPEKLVVDHCHKTGRVRGLLCDPCNTGIGRLQDDVLIVAAALKYLQAAAG